MEEPSNPIPSSRAPSNSSTVMANPFKKPRMSVNQSRMNLTSFSFASFKTCSFSLSISSSSHSPHLSPLPSGGEGEGEGDNIKRASFDLSMTVRDAFVCFQTCQRQVEPPLSFQYPFVFLA